MSWKSAFDYAGRIAARHGLGEPERHDRELPLGARIGGIIRIQRAPFIRAEAGGSLVNMPADADERIVAVSQLQFRLDGSLYRFYLDTGDGDGDERFVQVFTDARGNTELMYCAQLARIIPQTADEQEAFTGAAGSGLGERTYTLWRDQLAGLGLPEARLAGVFGASDQLDYLRAAGNGEPFIAPFAGKEVRIDDDRGMRGLQQEVYFMPYARVLADGGSESLLISTEIVESVNGDTHKRGIHVDFVIGIPLEAERVSIQ